MVLVKGRLVNNNVLILGDVRVGKNTWIGPNVILDGTRWARNRGLLQYQCWCTDIQPIVQLIGLIPWVRRPQKRHTTKIGNGVYIGPNSIIQMGVTVEDKSVIGAMSFLNKDVKRNQQSFRLPLRGHVAIRPYRY